MPIAITLRWGFDPDAPSGTGALQAAAAAVVGAGTVSSASITGTGVLASQSALVDASGGLGIFGTGDLQAQASILDASGVIEIAGSGVLAAQPSVIAGSGLLDVTGTGVLESQAATVMGVDAQTIPAVVYDGLQGHLLHTGGPAGAADGAGLTVAWAGTFNSDGSDMVLADIPGTVPALLIRNADNTIDFIGGTSGAVFSNSTTAVASSLGFLIVLASANGTTSHLYVIHAAGLITGTNTPGSATNLDLTANWYFGADGGAADFLDADTAMWWADDSFIDFSDSDNREQFWDTTGDLLRVPGADGSNPLDGAFSPLVCHKSHAASHTVNSGTGGNADTAGSFEDGTSPGVYAIDYEPELGTITGAGVLESQSGTLDGAGLVDVIGTGVLESQAASVVGTEFTNAFLANVDPFNVQTITSSPHNLGAYTAAAGANRKFIFAENIEVDATGSGVTGLTWGGVSASSVIRVDYAPALNIAQIWEIDEADFPGGATGDIVLTLTSTGDGNGSGTIGFAGTVVNVEQQAAEATASSAVTTNSVSNNITTLTNNTLVIDSVSAGNSGTLSITEGPDQVEDDTANAPTGGRNMAAGISHRLVATAGEVTLGWAHSGTANRLAHVLAAYAPVAGPAAITGTGVLEAQAAVVAGSDAAAEPATIAQTDAVNNGSNLSTYTFTGRAFGTEAADRFVAVTFHIIHGLAAPADVASVTIGGEAASITGQRKTGSGTYSGIAIVALPTGTTGDVVLTTTGGNKLGCYITIQRITGIGSVTAHDTDSAAGTDLSVTLTVPANGVALGAAMAKTGGAGNCAWTGLTETADAGTDNGSTSTAANEEFASGANVAMAAVFTTAASTDTAFYASWAPA